MGKVPLKHVARGGVLGTTSAMNMYLAVKTKEVLTQAANAKALNAC